MSLGFRKNDYRKVSSDVTETEPYQWEDDDAPLFSEILESQDILWDLWNFLQTRTDEMSIPIFDEGSFPDFLNFFAE